MSNAPYQRVRVRSSLCERNVRPLHSVLSGFPGRRRSRYSFVAMIAAPAFRSEEHFTQEQFRRWVDQRPRSEIDCYEFVDGRTSSR